MEDNETWLAKGRFTHSMPCPCRAAKSIACVFPIWFTQCGRVWFTLAMPRPCHALAMPFFSRPRHGQSMPWERHGKCESDTAALCKSNGIDTFQTFSGTAWQGNGMGAAWTRHVMCESAFNRPNTLSSRIFPPPLSDLFLRTRWRTLRFHKR